MGATLFERLTLHLHRSLGPSSPGVVGGLRDRDWIEEDLHEPTSEEQVASIRRNLERLFNTRSGSASACPDYGLPDLNDLLVGAGEHSQHIEQTVAACVTRYEPRLTNVQVRGNFSSPASPYGNKPDQVTISQSSGVPFLLQLEITGRLAAMPEQEVTLSTTHSQSGRFEVK